MAMATYMTVKGRNQGEIRGDCGQQGRENAILCYYLDHGVAIPIEAHTGMPTGQRIHRPLKVTTHMGKHTPKIFQACCSGELLDVEIDMFQINEKGMEEKYFNIQLQNAIIVEAREWYPETFMEMNRAYRHMQDIYFSYETIIWTYVIDGIEAQDSWKRRPGA